MTTPFLTGELESEAITEASMAVYTAANMTQVLVVFLLMKPSNRKKLGSNVKRPQWNNKNVK